jgi:hypothetical protein
VTNQDTTQELVDHYLTTLRNQLYQVPLAARDEFMNEITEHIAEGRADMNPEDVEGLRTLLAHIGSPSELAREVIEGQRDQQRQLSLLRRVRTMLGPLLALVVAGLIIASLLWWTHYQPLRQSPLMQSGPSVSYSNGKYVPQVNAASSSLPGEVPIWDMPKGASTVHIIVSIENAGSFPIKITGVKSPVQGWAMFGPAQVGFGRNEGGPTRPFHPFTVGGHQESEVSLAIPMHCMANSETVELSRVLVSTSFFGQTHQTWINTAPFNIVFAKSC